MIDGITSLTEISRALGAKEISAADLVEHYLACIAQHDATLGAFEIVTEKRARTEAEKADAELRSGDSRGPLHGIPFAVKDVIDVAGERTGLGLPHLAREPVAEDAFVVRQLREAGMVLLGKTRTPALACDVTGLAAGARSARNPWKKELYASGGSSSGSAVAVAAGLAPVALGTDTGGSIRIPSALCGVSGIKPAHDPTTLQGVHPLCPSLDTIGVIAKSVNGACTVLDLFAPNATLGDSTRLLRIAELKSPFILQATPDVQTVYARALKHITASNTFVENFDFPHELNVDLSLMWKEFASEAYFANAEVLSDPATQRDPALVWMFDGNGVSKGARERSTARRASLIAQMLTALTDIDLLALPTTPDPALAASDLQNKHLQQSDRYAHNSLFANYFNLPAAAFPVGLSHSGLPVSMTLCCKPEDRWMLQSVAETYQSETDWHLRPPPLD